VRDDGATVKRMQPVYGEGCDISCLLPEGVSGAKEILTTYGFFESMAIRN